MKRFKLILALVVLTASAIGMFSCESKSGKRRPSAVDVHTVEYVLFTGKFITINDSIVMKKADSTYYKLEQNRHCTAVNCVTRPMYNHIAW